MLKSVGVKWALAGHSERRTIFGETDEYINGQCLKLMELGMNVMLCIGESESEYDQNLAGAVCAVQLKKGLAGISKEQMSRVAIAYEPGMCGAFFGCCLRACFYYGVRNIIALYIPLNILYFLCDLLCSRFIY